MDFIDRIICEEINRLVLLEGKFKPSADEAFKKVFKYFLHYKHKGLSSKIALEKAVKKYKKKMKERGKTEFRLRKRKGGGSTKYDYTSYKEKNRKVSVGDYAQLASRIDQEKTDIAAVAREVFPDHTEEGAQSQLRKILNGERPMTARVAQKLEDMISSGQIAIKT